MAKTKTLPYWRIAAAARECELAVQTLDSAVTRGGVKHVVTECGQRMVKLVDVEAFARSRPARGRKPKLS